MKDYYILFYYQWRLALTKSAIFVTTADEEAKKQNFVSASISAYYSLFHLSLCLMFMFAERLPNGLLRTLENMHSGGEELPNRLITHKGVENFLRNNKQSMPFLEKLYTLFFEARDLREFVNYGPRIAISFQETIPVKIELGPCGFTVSQVTHLIKETKDLLPTVLKDAVSKDRVKATLLKSALSSLLEWDALDRDDLPFKGWSSETVIKEAKGILTGIKKELATRVGS